jgi:hypothetical protein
LNKQAMGSTQQPYILPAPAGLLPTLTLGCWQAKVLVLTFYKAQVALVENALVDVLGADVAATVEVATVDSAQVRCC